MDFGFSDEQQEVQNLARKILGDQVDENKLAAFDEYKAERFDRDLWGKMAEAGLLGVAIDEAHGGMGFGFTELCLVVEELGRTIAPLPLIPTIAGAAAAIQKFGSAAQQERWLPGVVAGETLLSVALTEEQNNQLATPIAVTAVADGDDYLLSGCKTQVAFARQSQRIVVGAATENGVILALVDPAASGVELRDLKATTFEPQCNVVLDGVKVGAEDILVADESNGAAALVWLAERQMAALCAMQTGITDHAMRMTASYTAERKQFGVPVATFQAVGHRAANCFIDVACLRLTTYQAVSLLDSEAPATTEVQIAKIWAGDTGHRVSYAAQHLHGGTGIDRDYPLWRYCLWLRHNELALGGSASQLAQLGSRIAAGDAYCS